MKDSRHRCEQADCAVSTDGKCLEGLDFAECPYHFWTETEPSEVDSASDDDSEAGSDGEAVRLAHSSHSGESLEAGEVQSITYANHTNFLFLCGEPDCGKTTLLACLHERFLRGTFAGYQFAGSKTLVGLERICHRARITSGRAAPDTERTKHTETARFLHWRLQQIGGGAPEELLVSDISGEAFRNARYTDEDALKLDILKRGDLIALLIDGDLLRDRSRRQGAKSKAFTLLRALIRCNLLSSKSEVVLVNTKWDLCHRDPEATDFINNFRRQATSQFGDQVSLSFLETCARNSADGQIDTGQGVDELLKKALANRQLPPPQKFRRNLGKNSRAASRYAVYDPPPSSCITPTWDW